MERQWTTVKNKIPLGTWKCIGCKKINEGATLVQSSHNQVVVWRCPTCGGVCYPINTKRR